MVDVALPLEEVVSREIIRKLRLVSFLVQRLLIAAGALRAEWIASRRAALTVSVRKS